MVTHRAAKTAQTDRWHVGHAYRMHGMSWSTRQMVKMSPMYEITTVAGKWAEVLSLVAREREDAYGSNRPRST